MAGMEWTDEMVATLRGLREEQLSTSQIAARLSNRFSVPLTRNAVIGKLFRLGTQSLWRKPPAKVKPLPARRRSRLWTAPVVKRRQPPSHPPEPKNLDIYALKNGVTCKWPLNDGEPRWLFCGHTPEAGTSYCAYHHALGTETIKQRATERRVVSSFMYRRAA